MNLNELWNHNDPAGSEARFRAALETANGDDVLILHTQIARTHGLRKQFVEAQHILRTLNPSEAGPKAQAHYWLEWGRTFCSATHAPESQTDEAHAEARRAFQRAFEIARDAQLDGLAVDALHMLAFVETTPEAQLECNQNTLAFVNASNDPEAKRWAASLHHNIGYALYQAGRLEEALEQFKQALVLREHQNKAYDIRVARWMIAWTLRGLSRLDEALKIQLELERECAAANDPDPYVFEELTALYEATGDTERAEHYRAKHAAVSS